MVNRTRPELQPCELKLFQDLMFQHAGIRLSDAKMALVHNRLVNRVCDLKVRSFAAYFDLVMVDSIERQWCIDALTTNETFFFRHKAQWDWLVTQFVPGWLATRDSDQTLNIWSAACSSGEEPYSAAILLKESLPAHVPFYIQATDINATVVGQALDAAYGHYAIQLVEEDLLANCFDQLSPSSWRVSTAYREHIRFAHANLFEWQPSSRIDLVFMRNVLIYFDVTTRRQALQKAHDHLSTGGVLLVGASETISEADDLFERVTHAIYRRRP